MLSVGVKKVNCVQKKGQRVKRYINFRKSHDKI